MQKDDTVVHSPGLIGGLNSFMKSLFGLVVSRLELAALEASQVGKHLVELVILFGAAILTVWFAIAYGTATIVALAWDEMGWMILLIMFLVFAVITGVLVAKGLALLKQNKLSLPATMKELKNDRDMLL